MRVGVVRGWEFEGWGWRPWAESCARGMDACIPHDYPPQPRNSREGCKHEIPNPEIVARDASMRIVMHARDACMRIVMSIVARDASMRIVLCARDACIIRTRVSRRVHQVRVLQDVLACVRAHKLVHPCVHVKD